MKATKKIIPALVMLLVSAVLLSTASYAWFSMNKTVTATGMQVKATTASSLIISGVAPDAATTTTEVTFTPGFTTLSASTNVGWVIAPETGLAYVADQTKVNVGTGLGVEADTPVTSDGAGTYYVDYTVYIAASGSVGIVTPLNVKLSLPTEEGELPAAIHGAVAVDFFVGAAATENTFKGTIHLADRSDETVELSENVPMASEGNLKVTMRVYLDGAFEDPEVSGSALVRNAMANVAELVFGAEFYVA